VNHASIRPARRATETRAATAPPAGAAVRRIAADADWSCGIWLDVLILAWRGVTDEERALVATSTMRELARTRERFAVVVVVEPAAHPPGSDTRPLFAAAMRACGRQVVGVAYVVPTDGFRGAAIRSAITGLSLLAREAYPTKAFRSIGEAAAWVAPRVSSETSVALLESAVDQVRRATPSP